MKIIGVIGYGSWGTALVKRLTDNGHKVHWWVRRPEFAEIIKNTGFNPKYLSQSKINTELINVTTAAETVICYSDLVLFVTPSAFLHEATKTLTPSALGGKKIASAIKGLEGHTQKPIHEYFGQQFHVNPHDYCAIAGPSHAEEVAADKDTYLTFASENTQLAASIAKLFKANTLHTSITQDVSGVEIAGLLKNIYAIGVGLALGLGYNDNFIAVFIPACLREMVLTLSEICPGIRDVMHSAYLGDLLVTAYSTHSRNRRLGLLIAQGLTPQQAFNTMNMIAEGYYATKIIHDRTVTPLPIADLVYKVLYEQADVQASFEDLRKQLH